MATSAALRERNSRLKGCGVVRPVLCGTTKAIAVPCRARAIADAVSKAMNVPLQPLGEKTLARPALSLRGDEAKGGV